MLGRRSSKRKSQTKSTRPGLALIYYRSRGLEKSGRSPFERQPKAPTRLRAVFSRIIDILLVLAIAAAIIYSLIVKPQALVRVSSEVYHQRTSYQAAAQRELKKFKNRNKVTFDQSSLVDSMKRQYPEIRIVSIELPLFGQKPKISLDIAPPTFILASGKQKFIVDKQGTAVTEAQDLPQVKNLPLLSDESGFKARRGQQVLNTAQVDFINTVIAQCRQAKVGLSSLVLPPRAQELDLRLQGADYYVKFYFGGDPTLQIGQFLAARHQFEQSGMQPSEYLDVRVNGKVYYK